MQIKEYAKLAGLALVIHWGFLILGSILAWGPENFSLGQFWANLYDQYSKAGDIPHYVDIAKNWYHAQGENANNIVFFPLFPLLMKFFQLIFRDYIVAGIFVANICTAVGNVFFYEWIKEETDEDRAWESLLIFNLFPVGFFMIGAYTESLFFMLTVMGLYYLKKRNWLALGIVGCLGALSRSQGIVLLIPAVYEICLDLKEKKFKWTMLAVGGIPLGMGIYLLINKMVYGQWTIFLKYQSAKPWFNNSQWIATNIKNQVNMGENGTYLGIIIYWPQVILYFGILALLVYAYVKKVKTAYLAYAGAYVFMSYLHGWMISGLRYMMVCLPVYLILAWGEKKNLRKIILVSFSILYVFFSMWYAQRQAIM